MENSVIGSGDDLDGHILVRGSLCYRSESLLSTAVAVTIYSHLRLWTWIGTFLLSIYGRQR